MKQQHWLVVAVASALAITGCTMMGSDTGGTADTDESSSSSSGTMRRAESGSNTQPNSETRESDCLPGDTRAQCAPDTEGTQSDSQSRSSESATDVETPESGAPVPR